MVTKKTSEKVATKNRVKVGKLQLNKETIKELAPGKQKQVKGGAVGTQESRGVTCSCLGAC